MRISTEYKFDSINSAISQADQTYVKLGNELSTGKSINQVSDDPYTASLAISQTALQSTLTQYNTNITYANSFLGLTDSSLSSIESLTNSAISLTQQAANSTVDQSARAAMASQVAQLEQRLVSLGNTQTASGSYIFAGQVTQTQPYTVSGSTLTYNGDSNAITAETGPNSSVQINTDASSVITGLYSQLTQLQTDLASGNVTALSGTDLSNLQNTASQVLQLRGNVGAAVQTVTADQTMNEQRITDLTKDVSSETDADYASTIVKYTTAQNAYQGALTVASQTFKLSLLNFLQ